MRSTCVATMLEAGHAVNALPQSAKAICNCRILPGVPQSVVLKEINDMLADSQIVVHVMDSAEESTLTLQRSFYANR